ncbi:hypothetical protein CLV92_11674 [Kineococcus xinjiangensis]|uniref:SMI1/KNR4 family protein SUKH-1 n=1 Tax=Kineococcus xinjiangensis TaxID=512762 RepID=A0A2S6IDB6_9ACTN|nr:SMI1/KNR4 family protein [Kineococcus xinjiangensis]PPK92212.1 hypothetical protein CLV92_11674 [Kineococcus xinjiangensis]
MTSLDALLQIAGNAEYAVEGWSRHTWIDRWGRVGNELVELLSRRNGFYAFESALHVYGLSPEPSIDPPDLIRWNARDCWRAAYGDLITDCLFFGEDVFGGQFLIPEDGESVATLDPETGDVEVIAASLEHWAEALLADWNYMTGHSLAHAWQERHGRLIPGQRLLPKLPFVVGGRHELDNLHAIDATKGMNFRGEMAVQISALPEGAPIRLRVIE